MFIGAAKAGSTWFSEILSEHPGVFVPPNRGTYFFCNSYDLGLEWYARFFPRNPRGRAIGEICHDYLPNPDALRRIREYNSDMRLICCLRNPYERAISAWQFYGRNGIDLPTLIEHGKRYPHIFDHGCYATQLRALKSLFPDEQLLIFLYEDLKFDPGGVARRLYEFIGVDPTFVPPSLHLRVNPGSRARSRAVAHLIHDLHMLSWGRSRWASTSIGWLKRIRPLRRTVTALLYDKRPESGHLTAESYEFPKHVVARYEEQIDALEGMLGRDLSGWRANRLRIPLDIATMDPDPQSSPNGPQHDDGAPARPAI